MSMKMQKTGYVYLAIVAMMAISRPALALNYFELEVYPYQTASENEKEFENATSVGSTEEVTTVRSSFEFNYGLTDKIELAAYADFFNSSGQTTQLAAGRLRGRTRFFEKGELPVDLGAYAELEFPRNETAQIEGEIRGIIEKDFDRFTLALNPMVERVLKSKEPEVGGEEAEHEFEFAYATSVSYRMSNGIVPHLDYFGELSEEKRQLISPAVDVRLGHGFSAGARVAFGLNDETEKRLAGLRFEYEF